MEKIHTLANIAYKVLKTDKSGHVLHYKVITKKAFEQGLIKNNDIITSSNISAAINAEIRKRKLENKPSRFISYGKGRFGLLENEPIGILKDVRNKNESVKKALLESLMQMPPFSFEELVAEILKNIGFENINVTAKTGDGGIDVTGELVVAGAIKNNICVQVKRWRNNVQRSSIAELRGSLRPYQTGLFITTSNFSQPAIKEANDPYKAPISLISGKELVDIMCSYGIGVVADDVTIYELDDKKEYFDAMPTVTQITNEGIEIFAVYKKEKYYAVYLNENNIIYDNTVYKSPSAAANKVQSGKQVNGWKFWKYIDKKTGKIFPLDRLRDGK